MDDMKKLDERMKRHIRDRTPKKTYIYVRDRKRFEIFWDEILVAILVIAMLVMLVLNYQYTQQNGYLPSQKNKTTVNLDVDIEETMLDMSLGTPILSHQKIYKF